MRRALLVLLVMAFVVVAGCGGSPQSDKLSLAAQGRVDGLGFGIGSDAKKIESAWGKPQETGFFAGGFYQKYEKGVIFSDGDENDYGRVTMMSFEPGQVLYGVKVGLTPREIIDILGKPSGEGNVGEGDELAGEDYEIAYKKGKYVVSFYAKDEASPTVSASISESDE